MIIFSETTNFRPSKQKEIADNNSKFDERGRDFSKQEENTVGKEDGVFKRLALQARESQGLRGICRLNLK